MTNTHNQISIFDLQAPTQTHDICPTCSGLGVISLISHNSRTTDPETSRNAGQRQSRDARRFSSTSRQARLLRALVSENMTAQEAALKVLEQGAPISAVDACRRRMSDLKRVGFVLDSGERRHNKGSLDESVVWKITPAGVSALRLIDQTGWST
jgi:hypothetical protein